MARKSTEATQAYNKWYHSRPEVKNRQNALARARYANDPAKEKRRLYRLANLERIKAKRREKYKNAPPEVKAKLLAKLNQWAKDNPEKVRANMRRQWLKRAYGITMEEYEKLLASQGGKCAICKTDRELNIDHCHKSKVIRGILCNRCNQGLGYFQENPSLLKLAAAYLETLLLTS